MKQTIIRTFKTIFLTVVTFLLFSVVFYQFWVKLFPKNEAIERVWPQIEQARKYRAEYFNSIPADEIKKRHKRALKTRIISRTYLLYF